MSDASHGAAANAKRAAAMRAIWADPEKRRQYVQAQRVPKIIRVPEMEGVLREMRGGPKPIGIARCATRIGAAPQTCKKWMREMGLA